MAYVLGYLYADGNLEDAPCIRGKYTRVSSIEKENITVIRTLMNSQHKIYEIDPEIKKRRKRYLLRIGSHKIYNDLIKIGLFPNKSLTIKFPRIPSSFLDHFVLGYFDGDGCVRICKEKGKRKAIILKKLSVVFTCGSFSFLKSLSARLKKEAGTNHTKIYNGCRSFMLSYSTGDSIKIFKFFYGKAKRPIFSRRKFDIFRDYFELRPQRVDRRIKKILEYGRVAK